MQPYQERVLEERIALREKLQKLRVFLERDLNLTIPLEEQKRLKQQASVMQRYMDILDARIEAFSK